MVVNMKNCNECGKKLRFFEGYAHPIFGKKYFLCTKCFDFISRSMKFYRKCLFEGRKNHKKECYFWDSKTKNCKNEKYFNKINSN